MWYNAQNEVPPRKNGGLHHICTVKGAMNRVKKRYNTKDCPHVAFPLGGIGAGMFCIQGNGMLSSFSLRNRPDLFFEPNVYAALCVKREEENIARVLEGPVPDHKIFGQVRDAGLGLSGKNHGLPRFRGAEFSAKFPFAGIELTDETVPLSVSINAFSPFVPHNADWSSLPVASIEYVFENKSNEQVEAVFYFSSVNFMKTQDTGSRVFQKENGFVLSQRAVEGNASAQGDFYVAVDHLGSVVNTDWFAGGWFDERTMQWNDIKAGVIRAGTNAENNSPGGSVAVALSLAPGMIEKINVQFAWYVPNSTLCITSDNQTDGDCYKPWYADQFANVEEVMNYFCANYRELYQKSAAFSRAHYDADLPKEIIEAAGANLAILKSPTILRQTDGRIWAWEGSEDEVGSCPGSCTHVWNYEQAIWQLFPKLARGMRQTEFFDHQNQTGHQQFRVDLPIKPTKATHDAATDGQLGCLMKLHREWKMSGDMTWLAGFWERAVSSIEYCITEWDKQEEGILREPQHNTYDIWFWGTNSMCSTFYLGALRAMVLMGEALGKDTVKYETLYQKGRKYIEEKLFNGEYFEQIVEWKTLDAYDRFKRDLQRATPRERELLEQEGPKYQYGTGCLSDGVFGCFLAKLCGIGEILDPEKVKSHLLSVYKYNFKRSLRTHENPQRPGYAIGGEGGLLLCSWPRGGKPSLPFVYSDEVWTGIEYQVASHLISYGFFEEGLDIVRTCRARYDGTRRNPFNEYECGHWYARALASYGLIQTWNEANES